MLIALASLKGSPGVTTFAVALAATWPGGCRRVLVECDPSGGDLGVRFGLPTSPGLVSLAAAGRTHDDPELVWRHAWPLPSEVPVVAAPPGAEQARAAVAALAPARDRAGVLVAAGRAGGVVLVDCGRLDPASPAWPLVAAADALLLMSGAHADELAHLAARLTTAGRWSRHPALLLVGEGHSSSEVTRELGVPVLAQVPHDPRSAAALSGRPTSRRTVTRSGLARVAHQVARALTTRDADVPRTSGPDAAPVQAGVRHPIALAEKAVAPLAAAAEDLTTTRTTR
ncbi:hypothetical protein UA75_16530 [Actinoalloteichus sp. GBA129-24]|nr:hypothetical protein UA75_16530 [Actinoalloteichus sp. GBA129-24]